MRRILHLASALTILCCLAQSSGAATVSGTIYTTNGVRGVTPVPAVGARVSIYLWPSSSGYISTTTSSTGTYSITIPSGWPASTPPYTQSMINVGDSASSGGCFGHGAQIVYYGLSLVFNDTLCNYPWYTIAGKVSLQGGGAAANAKVWLIGEQQDTTGGVTTTTLSAYDSTVTNATGDYYFTKATGYWITTQRVKAALQSSHSSYWSYLPTYHDSSLVWSGAATFAGSAWTTGVTNLNISLRGGTNPGGPGFIGGDVLLGANKSAGVGDPLSGRLVMLTTGAGQAVAYAYSDASGHFSFPNLQYGTYKLFGDAWGLTNPPLTVTISVGKPSMADVVFEENSTTFAGHLRSLGVGTGSALQTVIVYPSPMDAYFEITALGSIAGEKTAILRSITGATVSTTIIAERTSMARIATIDLPAGMYVLELQTSAGISQYRLIKK